MHRPARWIALVVLLSFPALSRTAEADPCGVGEVRSGAPLAAALAGDGSLTLSDGRRLVPAGIVIPAALRPDQDLVAHAAAATAKLLEGRFLKLGTTTMDRHGRLVGGALVSGPATDTSEESLVLALLEAGAGYADPRSLPRCGDRLLAAEDAARRAHRGIFATGNAFLPASDDVALGLNAGLFTLAEGRVKAAGSTRETVYLNFGPRWRDDFTVILAAKDFATILRDDLNVATLRGTRVRVRGVVREDGGPAMFVRRADEISVLTDPQAADAGKGEAQ